MLNLKRGQAGGGRRKLGVQACRRLGGSGSPACRRRCVPLKHFGSLRQLVVGVGDRRQPRRHVGQPLAQRRFSPLRLCRRLGRAPFKRSNLAKERSRRRRDRVGQRVGPTFGRNEGATHIVQLAGHAVLNASLGRLARFQRGPKLGALLGERVLAVPQLLRHRRPRRLQRAFGNACLCLLPQHVGGSRRLQRRRQLANLFEGRVACGRHGSKLAARLGSRSLSCLTLCHRRGTSRVSLFLQRGKLFVRRGQLGANLAQRGCRVTQLGSERFTLAAQLRCSLQRLVPLGGQRSGAALRR
mmetsp:Transcript_5058/g.16309  ORF Transcript_5058/g.16309 Transcript_5058/m.16309 type:complete len:298 (-) Transcript_5058:160-1053(-)